MRIQPLSMPVAALLCQSVMKDFLREEIKGTISRLSLTIHLCVYLTATKDSPIIDEVLPTADMIQEDRLEFLRTSVRSS
jgi:hypothetical protein